MEDSARLASADEALGALGEEAVLARILPLLTGAHAQELGPGDDAAVIRADDGRFVVTTDLMVHGPDFLWEWSSPYDVGCKAAASNLSDVAAMGARPTALLVALAAPPDTPVGTLEDIARGLSQTCRALAPGCGIVGGDLSTTSTFTVAITAFGDLEGRRPVVRSGARVGDQVAVSGTLGLAGEGLRLLRERGVDAAGRPDAAAAARVRERHPRAVLAQLAPQPPIGDGAVGARAGATSMIDLSDGLALDARRVARASQVAIDFESAALGEEPHSVLAGGEDHSLLATFPPEAELVAGFRRVGRVVSGEGVLLDGRVVDTAGWDPYAGV